ncbi:hypothetical protein QE429_003369 [Bacillus sp. SORGH_AS 510]|nr:hypothetical protein [Bacillus sp. SORGH_AS_0510]
MVFLEQEPRGKIKAVLKNIVDLYTLLIVAEGTKTPVGVWFWGDPAGAFLRGGSPKHLRTARAWSGNQQSSLTEPLLKAYMNIFIIIGS